VLEGRSSTLAGKRVYLTEKRITGTCYQRWRVKRWVLEGKMWVLQGKRCALEGSLSTLAGERGYAKVKTINASG